MIVIEGVRNAGKTDLAARLRQDTQGGYSYRSGRAPNGTSAYTHLLGVLADAHPRLILDEGPVTARLRWSSACWETCFTRHEWRVLHLVLLGLDSLTVWMPNPRQENQLRLPVVGNAERVERFLAAVENAEIGIGRSYGPRTNIQPGEGAEIDPDTYALVTQRPSQSAMEGRSPQALLPFLPATSAYGARRPTFIVIGEEPPHGVPSDGTPDVPFGRGPASALLWEAADAAGLRWWEGWYANAWALDDARLDEIADRLNASADGRVPTFPAYEGFCPDAPLQTIVALGARARETMRDLEARLHQWGRRLAFLAVDHPSAVLRFRHRERTRWALEFAQALAPHCENIGDVLELMGGDVDEAK